ncbi:hypothetical protein [Alkalicoccobacillus plakortidis]|uniref:Uncharacterized protein n=1 Tax=Alkalicoccobacillus plakortidis TaxID=444060 RepID=A0ABT0XG69_9BACI|nr:hypothetical protein [Alkalicoccobacillus plakortidis]MCM2674901.1 hypothetical protein [Alkalicoccobacillus plakortidis]
MIDWLAEPEDYTDFTSTSITLDEPSPLLDMEIPEQTTEPEQEPWRQPQGNYRWYDRSTFASGSFGSGEEAPAEVVYEVSTPDILPLGGESFEVTVKVDHLEPGQSISDLDMQVYLSGGQAISQVQAENGSLPNGYGYQSIGSLTADDQGTAEKVVTLRLNPSIAATTASIRLRNDRQNVVTQTVALGQSLTEQQPAAFKTWQTEINKYALN